MIVLEEIRDFIQKGKVRETEATVRRALEEGLAPDKILSDGLIAGMSLIGAKYKNNEIFVPEVLVAARAMNVALTVLKPMLKKEGYGTSITALLCTVKGDLHDVGKNLVKIMLEGAGVNVIDLGIDCGAKKIIDAIKATGAELVCLSALLTTTLNAQKDIIDSIKEAGLRDKVKIIVGGAPTTQEFANEIGADWYASDAASAAEIVTAYFSNSKP